MQPGGAAGAMVVDGTSLDAPPVWGDAHSGPTPLDDVVPPMFIPIIVEGFLPTIFESDEDGPPPFDSGSNHIPLEPLSSSPGASIQSALPSLANAVPLAGPLMIDSQVGDFLEVQPTLNSSSSSSSHSICGSSIVPGADPPSSSTMIATLVPVDGPCSSSSSSAEDPLCEPPACGWRGNYLNEILVLIETLNLTCKSLNSGARNSHLPLFFSMTLSFPGCFAAIFTMLIYLFLGSPGIPTGYAAI